MENDTIWIVSYAFVVFFWYRAYSRANYWMDLYGQAEKEIEKLKQSK